MRPRMLVFHENIVDSLVSLLWGAISWWLDSNPVHHRSALYRIIVLCFCSDARSSNKSQPAQTGVCQTSFVQNDDLQFCCSATLYLTGETWLTL